MHVIGTNCKHKGTWWNKHSEVCMHSPCMSFLSLLPIAPVEVSNQEALGTTGPIEVCLLIEFKYQKISQENPESPSWEIRRPSTLGARSLADIACLPACLPGPGGILWLWPTWLEKLAEWPKNKNLNVFHWRVFVCEPNQKCQYGLPVCRKWQFGERSSRRTILASNTMLAFSHLKLWHCKKCAKTFWT